MELTKSEMEIMNVLWENGSALSRSDFLQHSEGKTWKDNSVHILINGLLRKGVIREAGRIKCGKTYARTFLPTMTREAYFAAYICTHHHKPDIVSLIEAILERSGNDADTLEQLQSLLNRKRSQLSEQRI